MSVDSECIPGRPGSPGRATGRVLTAWSWGPSGPVRRVAAGQIPGELGRLAQALEGARSTLRSQREALPPAARRSMDEALDDLSDVVFLADVERLVLEEHLGADSAISKVVSEVEQLFGSSRAARARDLGARVVRGLNGVASAHGPDAVIVTRHLSVEDLASCPQAVVTEEECPAEAALELARALGVPVVVAATGAVGALAHGARIAVDGGTGQVRPVS